MFLNASAAVFSLGAAGWSAFFSGVAGVAGGAWAWRGNEAARLAPATAITAEAAATTMARIKVCERIGAIFLPAAEGGSGGPTGEPSGWSSDNRRAWAENGRRNHTVGERAPAPPRVSNLPDRPSNF